MKKKGIINAELIKEIALLGHMDLFMVGDAGMPIPEGVKIIDLALCSGVPSFEQTLDAVLFETSVEHYFLATEIKTANEGQYKYITNALKNVENTEMEHIELKEFSKKCKFAIRTGEFSPYPNVILRAGVVF